MKIYNSKKLFFIIAFVFGFLFSFLIMYCYSYLYLFSTNIDAKKYETKLLLLAKESILTKDVPVSSILLYKDSIVGVGRNDVVKNNNPSGHAEINAIDDYFKKIGYQKFSKLNKQELTLMTTFEPCEMCKGAIQECGIVNVVFSFAKRKNDKLNNFKNDLKYYFDLKQMKNQRLQYDLFKMHPSFDSISYPY